MSDPARLAAQALVSITGIWPKRAPQLSDLLAAEGLPDRWRGRLRAWMRDGQAPWSWNAPPDQDKLRDKIATALPHDEMAGWLTALGDPEIGALYADTIQNAREYLDNAWPKIEIGSVVPEVLPLSADDLAEVWSLVRVLDDADSMLDDLASWTITPSQVAAWRAVLPELSAMVDQLMTSVLVEHIAKKRPLSWQLEDLIRVFRGLPPEEQIKVPPMTDTTTPPPTPTIKIDFAATRTPSQAAMASGR